MRNAVIWGVSWAFTAVCRALFGVRLYLLYKGIPSFLRSERNVQGIFIVPSACDSILNMAPELSTNFSGFEAIARQQMIDGDDLRRDLSDLYVPRIVVDLGGQTNIPSTRADIVAVIPVTSLMTSFASDSR